MKIKNGGGEHAGRGWRGHSYEIFVAARRHALDVETRETPGAAGDENKPYQPAELGEMHRFGSVGGGHGANSPGVGERRGRETEADNIRERIEFPAEVTFSAHPASDATIHGIENVSEADGGCGVFEILNTSIEGGEDRVVAAEHIGYGEG